MKRFGLASVVLRLLSTTHATAGPKECMVQKTYYTSENELMWRLSIDRLVTDEVPFPDKSPIGTLAFLKNFEPACAELRAEAPRLSASEQAVIDWMKIWRERAHAGPEGARADAVERRVDVSLAHFANAAAAASSAKEALALGSSSSKVGRQPMPFHLLHDTCTGRKVIVPIEPLMGFLRHPYFHCYMNQRMPGTG